MEGSTEKVRVIFILEQRFMGDVSCLIHYNYIIIQTLTNITNYKRLKMKYLSYIWFLVFFLIGGCDDNPVVNCAEATAEIVTNEWPGQLEEFNTAIAELDESYTLPDDWKTNCGGKYFFRY